jgi:plastocyanin
MLIRYAKSRRLMPTLVVLVMLLLMVCLPACAIVRSATPTPSSDYTPRPTPGGGKNSIDLTTTDFARHTLTVRQGEDVAFVVRLDSGPHILCLGTNGQCNPNLPGPPELRQDGGFSVDAGQTLTVVFQLPGVYPITCSIYPSMNMVITVT